MTLYYYVDRPGPQQEAANYAMNWLLTRAALTPKKTGFAYIPTLDNLDMKTLGVAISKFFGDKPVKNLMLHEETMIGQIRIILLNNDNIIRDAGNCPLVAFYPAPDELGGLDYIKNITEMLLVPYQEKEATEWIRKRNAIQLRTSR